MSVHLRKSIVRTTIALGLPLIIGCSSGDGPSGLPVAGKVVLDGRPIESGQITFAREDGKAAATGKIQDGEFELRSKDGAIPGSYRVAIHAVKKTGKTIPHPDLYGETMEESVDIVPARYNVSTQLKAEIKPDSENTFEFALNSAVDRAKKTPARRRR